MAVARADYMSIEDEKQSGSQDAMSAGEAGQHGSVTIVLSHRGQVHQLHIAPEHTTLAELRHRIAGTTGVLPKHQKIVTSNSSVRALFAEHAAASGGEAAEAENNKDVSEQTLQSLGFPLPASLTTPLKLMLVGPRQDEVEAVRREDEQGARMNRPRQYHPSMLRGTKPRSTASSSLATSNPFHSVRVHHLTPPSAPEHDLVLSRLKQLSTDEAVVHVCRLHGFQVGELTELLPHEHPHLLGLNENMGQRISLRLRTDRYDGLTAYREVRRVLLHELAHNKVNDHPPEFKILNSELNAQVEAFERAKKEGTHRLIEGDVYVPGSDGDDESVSSTGSSMRGGVHVLGGAVEPLSAGPNDAASRRARVLEATTRRLEKAEAAIERGCGSSHALQ